MPEESASVHPGKSALRCVIWHGAAVALPGELLSSLSKRIGHMSVTTEEYSAFAELCKIERERRAAIALHQPPPVAAVLLLVHPRQLPGAAELVEAARLHAPSCTIWQYDRAADGANPKLRSVVEEDVRAWSISAAATPRSAVGTSAQRPQVVVRPGGGGVAQQAATPQRAATQIAPPKPANGTRHPGEHTPRAAAPTPLAPPLTQLTEDELKMLLSDDPVFPPVVPPQPSAHPPRGASR